MSKRFLVEHVSGVTVVTINAGQTFYEHQEEFLHDFKELLGRQGGGFILDLRHVEYISSLMLSSLVFIHDKAHETGGDLVICSVQPKVMDIIRIMCLDKFFRISDNRATAFEMIAQGKDQ